MRARIAFTVKGCPVHTQAPFPGGSPRLYWQRPSGAAAKPGGMATVRCGEFPPGQTLGSETRPSSSWEGREKGLGFGISRWQCQVLCPHSCMWLHRGAAPMHPHPAGLSNSLHFQLVRAFPNNCILLLVNPLFLKHIKLLSLGRPEYGWSQYQKIPNRDDFIHSPSPLGF